MPLKLDSWAGFVLEHPLLVRLMLVFVASRFSVTKSLRLANSFLFVFVLDGLLTYPFKG